MNISKKLKIWQEAQLITKDQSLLIEKFERTQSNPYLFYGLNALAVFCIGIGIISMIAANWNNICPMVKIGVDLLLLAGCAAGVATAYIKNRQTLFEVLLFLFALLVMASIGLIAQVYQLQPEGAKAFVLWSFLTLPLIFFTRHMLLPFLWYLVFCVSFDLWLAEFPPVLDFLMSLAQSWLPANLLIGMIFWLLVYQLLKTYLPGHAQGLKTALTVWMSLGVAGTIILLDMWSDLKFLALYFPTTPTYNNLFLISLGIVTVMAACSAFICYKYKQNYLIPYLMFVMILGALIPVNFMVTFAALFGVCVYAWRQNRVKLFNWMLVFAGIRVFIIYINVFESLMMTGMGLIVTGIVLLLLIFGWFKISAFAKGKIGHAK